MITEAQYAAATALFSSIATLQQNTGGREGMFDLYQQCLDVVCGKRVLPPTRTFNVTCAHCGESTEAVVPSA
ncbi:hypothetical protein ASD77_08210 [Pseudoxanthomonas sp. Root65]|uniref:hypothetical protein n=1 Tax=Pseudoxanthomonas sp. Root65 TaxID=1736576 RepID=UPI0006F81E40|nr:hypothetical protein [Pseudoxanthomonas sp. Root65]KRA54563.1 hypothetical protein ASD77_08210 [Pseudoxanthomonas sp. Root65]